MTTRLHGVDLRLEMNLPPITGFKLDVDHLDVGRFGADAGWQDLTCEVTEFAIQRGDVTTDQRPNAALELGTLSVTILDTEGDWIPDDLAGLLGLPPTGMTPGAPIRLLASTPADTVANRWWLLFFGKVITYDSEWIADTPGRLVTLVATDTVADLAAINPTAQPSAIQDNDTDNTRWNYLGGFLPAALSRNYRKQTSTYAINFRAETFAEPLMEQLQRWADTSVAHLVMRHSAPSTDPNVPHPWLLAGSVGEAVSSTWAMRDCLIGPPASNGIPLHWGHLSVQADGIVNDCLASSDNTAQRRYLAQFDRYGTGATYMPGTLKAITSDGGTTWGIAIGNLDRADVDRTAQWVNLPLDSTLELYFLGDEYERTGKVFRWKVQGPTYIGGSGNGRWLSGLIADVKIDYPTGSYLVAFGQTSDEIPESATAVRSIDAPSQVEHGVQDYRRLDLRLYKDSDAQKWADRVVAIAKDTTTYIDQAEVHIDRDAASGRAIGVDLLDRLQITKKFPAHANQVLQFTSDVVGVVDECDTSGWVRRFYLYPVSAAPGSLQEVAA